MTDKMQNLMTQAYDRWQQQSGWDEQTFWDHLDAQERTAVFLGNLNYQVENGGFEQWWSNGYATSETVGFILRTCARLGTDSARTVAQLVEEFWSLVDEQEYDRWQRNAEESDWEVLTGTDLDTRFYAVNKQFLADCETLFA